MPTPPEDPRAPHAALRTDLVVSRQIAPEGTVYVVKLPESGRFFRLKEAEHFIALQLDGSTSLEEIRRRAEARFGSDLPAAVLERFVSRLRLIGLLQDSPGASPGRPAGRIRGDPFYLRFKIMDPDRLLGWLAARLGLFFTPWFLAGSAALILAAVAISIDRRAEIARDVAALFRLDVLLFAWVTVLSVSALHEMAHGLTCKRFGGEVHEIGFLIIYLQPALYCNVSDAWLFPEKSRRLWVTFSGAYFEIVTWAASTFVWRLAEPGTALSEAALVVMATSGIKTLFNWNPLIKLDGYYLLSDALEIPNLRSKAVAYLKGLLRPRPITMPPADAPAPRERRIFLVYGLLASAYSVWLMGMIATHLGGYLVGRYQGAGALTFAVVMGSFFRGSLKKAFLPLGPWTRARWLPGRLGPRGRLAIAGAALLVVLVFGRMEHKVSGEFRILPSQNADVCALTDGVIEEVPVDEGDRVEAGDLIARISDRDLRAELAKVEAGLRERLAVLEMLREKVIGAGASLGKSEERLKYGRTVYGRIQALHREGLASLREVDEAAEQVAVRGKELEESRSALNVARDEIEATEAAVARLQGERDYLIGQIGLTTLRAPHAGVITTPRLKEKAGQYVKKGDLVAEVHTIDRPAAEISVPEKEMGAVRPGLPVVLKSRAFPERALHGRVVAVAPAVQVEEGGWGRTFVRVRAEIDAPGAALRSEMTGQAKILCGKRSMIDLLTRRITRYLRVEFWSWW